MSRTTERTAKTRQFVMIGFDLIDFGGLTAEEIGLYVIMKRFENHKSHVCYPSERKICALSGIKSPKTVRRLLKSLESKGFLTITNRKVEETNENDTNLYTILCPDVKGEQQKTPKAPRKAQKSEVKPKKDIVQQWQPEQKQAVEQPMKAVEVVEQVEHEAQNEKSIYDSCDFEGFSIKEKKSLVILAESKGMSIEKFNNYIDYMRNQRKKNKISNPSAYMQKLESEGVILGIYQSGAVGASVGATATYKPKKNAFNDFPQRAYDDSIEQLLLSTPLI